MNFSPRILLVDDDKRFVTSLHNVLNCYNYKCTEALNGYEAINILKEQQIDLALLDVDLPDISGCDILEYIKTSNKNTTAIMLTGFNTIETAVMSMKQGAYDFLNKPINHELLLQTITKALQHNELNWKLKMSDERFQILAESSWEGILIHENGKLIEANELFFTMFDYSPSELANGIFLEQILNPASLQIVNWNLENSFLSNSRAFAIRKNRKEFPVEIRTRSITYLGKPLRVCVVRDISERVKAEEEKFDLHEKIEKANRIQSLGIMAGAVAHDLNNILSGVVSYPDLLLSQMHETDKFYFEIMKIREAGKRAASVVADLVALARGTSSLKTVQNLNSIIMNHLDSIEHHQRLSNYPNVVIKTNLHTSLHNILCSPQQINKILLNLIGNALEVVKEYGQIRIVTSNCRFKNPVSVDQASKCTQEYVKLVIADDGPGIMKKDLEHIFEPFYSTKVMGKSGTGLGLSIVWNTVQEHNGWIEVSNINPGAMFEVYLPAKTNDICTIPKELDYFSLQGNGEFILLIDDQFEQNDTISGLLSGLGYKTHSVLSGEEGLLFLKSHPVDLVLLDMIMGDGLSGYETYKRILKIIPNQKAIIISGFSKPEDFLQAKNLGVSKFLEKPVTLAELGVAIKQALFETEAG